MTDFELVQRFQSIERDLKEMGYSISAIANGFYIHNSKGTIVADVRTIDGLRGFAQGIEWAKEAK
jgi:hypothetical protein